MLQYLQSSDNHAGIAHTEVAAGSVCNKIRTALEDRRDRSAWDKGVTLYAFDLVDQLEEAIEYDGKFPEPGEQVRAAMLGGASDWSTYSWGGSSLIYNADIATRLCCPSELKKTRIGERRPNAREDWLDTQARALYQAARRVSNLYNQFVKGGTQAMTKKEYCKDFFNAEIRPAQCPVECTPEAERINRIVDAINQKHIFPRNVNRCDVEKLLKIFDIKEHENI